MQFLLAYWWIPIMPAAAVLLLALLANLAGDGVSDMIGDR
jgi:peptide/nickel transport system permease protein